MQTALDLEDVWRINNEKFKRYTWFSSKSPRQMARLDFFLTTPDIHSKLKNTSISHGYRTDHSALTLELNLLEAKCGKGFWKFNTSLLHDKEYINVVKQEICNTISQYKCNEKSNVGDREFTINNQMFFEMLKLNIRGQNVAYSSRKAKYNRDKETKIEQNITNLENELTEACLSNSQDKIFELEKLDHEKLDLRDMREAKLKASVLRSKVQYYEEGEKATTFFCNLEKRNYINKVITKLNVNGKTIINPDKILSEQKNYYANIYSSKVLDSNAEYKKFLKDDNIMKLEEPDQNFCERPISEKEAKEVVKNMKNNKTPGTDGFPVEFYKFFWSDINTYLINSSNESFLNGELSVSQKQGIITCLP